MKGILYRECKYTPVLDSASKALLELPYTKICGQSICLSYADPGARGKEKMVDQDGNVFVKVVSLISHRWPLMGMYWDGIKTSCSYSRHKSAHE